MVQCIVQPTPTLLAVIVVVVMTVVVTVVVIMTVVVLRVVVTVVVLRVRVTVIMVSMGMTVVVAGGVVVAVTVIGVRMIVLVAMGIQLEQHSAHHGIRASIEPQRVIARIEMKGTAPFERQCLLQKITIEGELVAQIESMQVDHLIDRQIGLLGMQ